MRDCINDIPILVFAGWSGSGKTTLIESLIPRLKARHFWVAVIKHDVHGLKIMKGVNGETQDVMGTDTWRFRQAGADYVMALGPEGPELMETLCCLHVSRGNAIILIEGFKNEALPKIAVYLEEHEHFLEYGKLLFFRGLSDHGCDPEVTG